MNSAGLRSRARLAINKKQKYFLLPDHELAENLFLFLFFIKGKQGNKIEFATKFVGSKNSNYTHTKISQIACKTFATQCFYTNHLKHKTVNKTICKMPPVNPRQL